MSMHGFGSALAAVAAALAAGPASAQNVLHVFQGGGTAGKGLGHAVRAAGDVDLDGHGDLIVGYRAGSSAAGVNAGSARVFSGRDGSILHTFAGDSAQDALGQSVDGAGDVDGDGHADLVVAARLDDSNGQDSGSVYVYSGRTGGVLHVFRGGFKEQLGVSVAGAGDVNQDGRADLIAGANPDLALANSHGYARVYSGADGSVLHSFVGPVKTSRLGFSVAGAGDVDGDGYADVVVGDPRFGAAPNQVGRVQVFSGRDGAELHAFTGSAASDQLGWSVAGAGDVDADGLSDVIAGTPWANGAAPDVGTARVWSGGTGALLYAYLGQVGLGFFGAAVSGAGDVNADGADDFLIAAFATDSPGANAGSAAVYSGADGGVLFALTGDSASDEFGYALSAAGDVDADGGLDFAVGAPVDDAGGGPASGSVRVYAGIAPPPKGAVNYCAAGPNSAGPGAVMGWSGSLSVAANDLTLEASGLPGGTLGMFFAGPNQAQLPFGGGFLCIQPPLRRIPPILRASAGGVAWRKLDLAGKPGWLTTIQAGSVLNFQMLYVDRHASGGAKVNLTDGLNVTFQP